MDSKMKKAVILAGGKGLRLSQSNADLPKPMIPVAGKPILEYIVAMIKKLGFEDAYIVVGHKKELIREYFGDGSKFGLKIEYLENKFIDNKVKCGLSDAVLLLEGVIKEPFLTILGDEIYAGTRHEEMIAAFEGSAGACECMVAVHETKDLESIKKNYSVQLDADWNVLDLVEKPEKPFNSLIGCGTYIFRPSVFEYIRNTKVSERSGRKELADTMKAMVNEGRKVKAFSIEGSYLNVNYPQDLAEAERYLK